MNNLSFKKKSKKAPISDPRKNIYTLHNEMIDYFKLLQKSLPDKEKELKQKKEELEKLRISNRITFKKERKVPCELILKEKELPKIISKLEHEIKDIKCKKEENDYYLNTSEIIMQYTHELELHNNEDSSKHNSQMVKDDDLESIKNEKRDSFNLKDIISIKKSNRTDLLDSYLSKTNRYHYSNKDYKLKDETLCTKCNEKKIFYEQENTLVCPSCSVVTECLISPLGYNPTYKEIQDSDITPYFHYKKINHFNEWLSQIQAKETTDIPKDLLERLNKEIRKERVNPKSLKPPKIKAYLKKLGDNKYYEHAVQIGYLLNGVKPLTMSIEMEEKLRSMFEDLQGPFMRHKPKDRKNFLSYSYVLHKFCQLLQYDEFLSYFPLLKSREKLYQQDVIFKKCCKDLGWNFIPSI